MAQATLHPAVVQASVYFWIAAIVTAVIELVVRLGITPGGFGGAVAQGLPELGVRGLAYALLLTLSLFLLNGRNWARWALLIIFGVLGTFSLVFEPLQWLAEGGSVSNYWGSADAPTFIMAASRILHIACVWAGAVLMFLPPANAYFRTAR